MTTNPHPLFQELVQHAEELKSRIERSLINPHAWNFFDLSRLYRSLPLVRLQKPSVAEFATLITTTILLLYLHTAYKIKDKTRCGVDGWFLTTHYLREFIFQLISKSPSPITKSVDAIIALSQTMPTVTIPQKLKTCLIEICQDDPEATNGPVEMEDVDRLLLYEAFLIHFYPQLEGCTGIFYTPPPIVSFIVQAFTTLFPHSPQSQNKISGSPKPLHKKWVGEHLRSHYLYPYLPAQQSELN